VINSLEVLKCMPDGGWISGRELRALVNEKRCWFSRYSGAGFYLMMAELEDQGVVVTKMEPRHVYGDTVLIRMYSKEKPACA
jgi:hypothetical protein